MAKTESGPGKWDRAIDQFGLDLWNEDLRDVREKLRERMIPLLDALDAIWPHVWDNEFLKNDCEHTNYTRTMVKLRKERDKWLTK